MKKIILSLLLVLLSTSVFAEDLKPLGSKIFQIGGLIGGEISEVNYIYGGGNIAGGYRFDDKLTLLLKADANFTRQFTQFNIIGLYFGPEVQYKFYKDIFGFAGGGYALSIAEEGTNPSGTTLNSKQTFSSYYIEGGVGYEFQGTDYVSFIPKAGFRYSKVGNLNFMVPYGQIDIRFSF